MKHFHLCRLALLWAVLTLGVASSPALAQQEAISALSSTSSMAERRAAQDKLLDMGPAVAPLLRQGLQNADESIRIECLRLLGDIKDTQAVPDIITLIRDSGHTRTLLIACHSLGRIRDQAATPELTKMASMSQADYVRRRAAIVALGLLGDKSAIPTLTSILSEDDELLAVFAAGSLGLLGEDRGLSVALTQTNSPDPSVRLHAVQALGLIASANALPRLNELLAEDPPLSIRRAAELSAFQISLHDLPTDKKVGELTTQIAAARQRTSVTGWCISELGHIGGPIAEAALEKMARTSPDRRLRDHARRQLKLLNIVSTRGGSSDGD